MSDVNEMNINENYNQEIQGNQAEESRYVVAAGSNDEERQGLLDQISAYIDVISKAADNQFVTLSGDTKKEKMWQRTLYQALLQAVQLLQQRPRLYRFTDYTTQLQVSIYSQWMHLRRQTSSSQQQAGQMKASLGTHHQPRYFTQLHRKRRIPSKPQVIPGRRLSSQLINPAVLGTF